jgi:hypothetical protein
VSPVPEISDAALPWVLLIGCFAAGAVGGILAGYADRGLRYGGAWLAGRLSGLSILSARFGCDDCCVEDGAPHRYAGCPGNVRQHEREFARSNPSGGAA